MNNDTKRIILASGLIFLVVLSVNMDRFKVASDEMQVLVRTTVLKLGVVKGGLGPPERNLLKIQFGYHQKVINFYVLFFFFARIIIRATLKI